MLMTSNLLSYRNQTHFNKPVLAASLPLWTKYLWKRLSIKKKKMMMMQPHSTQKKEDEGSNNAIDFAHQSSIY